MEAFADKVSGSDDSLCNTLTVSSASDSLWFVVAICDLMDRVMEREYI